MFRGNVQSRYQKWFAIYVFVMLFGATCAVLTYFGFPWRSSSTTEEMPRAAPDPITRWYAFNKDMADVESAINNCNESVRHQL